MIVIAVVIIIIISSSSSSSSINYRNVSPCTISNVPYS